ncbi:MULTISPECIES: 3,4-dihydroxy-2-butanone-4-phosphate synthase [Metallosphaera]|uniref:3,4-dihydroxy-2-butanone 4-phosphate synthase n=3 Tax=Metallosphaera TaxID=41980 RepID=A4YCS1_METS5|nr:MULTISPECIES: 3,4-dihydroxy-2-butanone-4-phosphate synthase [Metallosphaera]ABP94223.1 3,4-dihydroxy-2-butanone 4-phosphate synthase [Metallosphaera sedula DSM 5348]AIM26210.1 3,4-dihydroxy-2-butanone 4-phosphate synthase [Metallosphaera sedula]AKV73232.1 3,4-dihydroxy-2-butanone 4-phosphate synthase [Metallosphaera sedula]AKV75476.1 3,4-dihydroxy-2-butanone 4-phosphate synthase [Metallosphaera sedula]AKV77722.1 3,4-dihydroxy-2-butanone 4-phosphate synthase [Metallosphaera sedula]
MLRLEEIRKDLEAGIPVLIYDFDGREEEVDMVFYAGAVSWKSVKALRALAGGLICYATGKKEAELLGLPFQVDILRSSQELSRLVKRPKYNDEPAFSIWVNHVDTVTGISDQDRALTITELHKVVSHLSEDSENYKELFYEKFYSPGHVPILISRGIRNRRGHTELSVALAEALGLERSMLFAEMLGEKTSLRKEEAIKFAKHNGFHFLEGKDILQEVVA